MKKLIYLSALCLGISATSFGQAGTTLLYGDFGASTAKINDNSKSKAFYGNLGLGYQFDNHWTAGVNVGYGTSRGTDTSINYWGTADNYNAGLFLRYTNRINRIFAFYTQGEIGYQGMKYGSTNSSASINYNGMYFNLYPAVSVFFYKGWALNFNLGGLSYNSLSEKGNSANNADGLDFNLGQQANIGVSVNFKMRSSNARFERHRNRERMDNNNDGYNDWRRDRKNRDSDNDED